ncbi:hypothetical protein H101_04153 [Trichophyton interdigitale H6]|nr:hypothetical protein H101_04153 [Trichophyton interdigitale H6]
MLWDGLEDLLYEEQRLEGGRVQGICLRGVFIISICQRNHGIQTEFEGINRTLLRIRATKMQTTLLLDKTSTPPAIVLKHLDDDLLNASDTQHLTRPEVKYVAKKVLEATSAFHEEGFVHTY